MDSISIDENKPTDNGEKEYINILLVGETGVGKSTFINSLANYMSYKFIDRLEKEKLHVLIPSIYKIKDKDNVEHEIDLSQEHDKNEFLEVGASATQCVKSYDFGIYEGRVRVRIIDTPGICDTKGIRQDEINCENIISYIKCVGKIHGICFLFKPTKARVTVDFEYCMMQILSRLDKSACKNLVFIFTNTRGSDYGPGDTLSVLQTIIKNIRKESNIDIPLNNNIFCFDNEAFRYLAAVERNVKFDKGIEENIRKSWEFSAKQWWSLVRYLSQQITPYLPDNLITVNNARNMLLHLSKIFTETSQLISSSNFVLDRLRDNRDTKISEIEELKGRKLDKVTDVEKVKIPIVNLVCTGATCAEVYKVGPEYKWHYKVCHKECTEIPEAEYEMIGYPELSRCLVIDRLSRKCLECNCDFSVHMQIDYETRIKDGYISNESVDKFISEKDEEIREFMEKIKVISSRNQKLKNELKVIQEVCVELAQYLKVNAVAPLTQSYKEYILYLISQQQILRTSSNSDEIEYLKALIENFEQIMRAFNEASEVDTVLNWQDIEGNLQNLFKLPLNGETIRTIYEQLSGSNGGIKINDYVHGDVFKKNEYYIENDDIRYYTKPNKHLKKISTKQKLDNEEGQLVFRKDVSVLKKEKDTNNTKKLSKDPGRYNPSKHSLENVPKNKTVDKIDRNKQPKRAELEKGNLKNLTVDELRELLDEKLRMEKANNKVKGPKHKEYSKGGNTASSRQRARTPPPPYNNQPSASHYPPYNYPHPFTQAPHDGAVGPPFYQHHDYQGYNTNPRPQSEPKPKETYEVTLKIPVPETHKYHPSPNQPPYTPSYMSPHHPHAPPAYKHAPATYPPAPPTYPHAPPTYQHAPPTYQHAPPTYPHIPPQQYNFRPSPQHGHGNIHPSQGSRQYNAAQNKNKEQKSQPNDKNQKDAKKGPKGGKPQFKPKKPQK